MAREVIHVRDSLTLAEDYKAFDVSAASCYLHHYDGSVGFSVKKCRGQSSKVSQTVECSQECIICTPDFSTIWGDSPHPHFKEVQVGPSCLWSQYSHRIAGVGVDMEHTYLHTHITH